MCVCGYIYGSGAGASLSHLAVVSSQKYQYVGGRLQTDDESEAVSAGVNVNGAKEQSLDSCCCRDARAQGCMTGAARLRLIRTSAWCSDIK